MKILYVLATIILLACMIVGPVYSDPPTTEFHLLEAGDVGGIRITHFAKPALHPACTNLEEHKYNEALILFQQEVARDPDSLIAYVGLVHSSTPKLWAKDINNLELKHVEQLGTMMEKFHLGLLLSCQYNAKVHIAKIDPPEIEYQKALHGKQLMYDAYRKCDDPNQALIMAYLARHAYIRDHFERFTFKNIEDEMILRLGGEQTSRIYQKAKKAHWIGSPPPVEGVPVANLRSFRAVVLILWCWTGGRSGRYVTVNGKSVLKWDPISPQQLEMRPYMDKWKAEVDKALEKLDKQ